MPGNDTRQPFVSTTRRRWARVAAALGMLAIVAAFLAIGPASAGDDRAPAEEAEQATALRSTGIQATSGRESGERLDPASASAIVASSTSDEIDADRIARAVERLSGETLAKAKVTTEPESETEGTSETETETQTGTQNQTEAKAQTQTKVAVETKVEVEKSAAQTAPIEVTEVTGIAGGILPTDDPILIPDEVTVDEDAEPFFIDVFSNDAIVVFPIIVDGFDAVGGSVECDSSGCVFTLEPDFFGTAGFTYSVIDEFSELGAETEVFIEVLAVNDGPRTPDRSFLTTFGAGPLVIDALDGVTDPEGDPVVVHDALIIEGVGDLAIDGNILTYTPPTDPTINPFASIDVFYQDEKGAFGTGHIFIEIEREMGPVCEEVELFTEELLVNRPEGSTAFTIPDRMLGCDYYVLELISTDGLHEPGYQTDQTGEAWFVEGIGLFAELAEVVYTSPTTPDLPDDETAAITTFGPISPKELGIRGWQLRHAGEGGVNSIYGTLRLIPSGPPPSPCDPVAVFEDIRLLNRAGDNEAVVPFTATACDLPVTIALVSTDFGHEPGFQTDQDQEVWSLEAYDAAGNLLFVIEGPDDLPDDLNGDFVYVEGVVLSEVAEFRVVHDAVGDGINSIDASVYLFFEGLP